MALDAAEFFARLFADTADDTTGDVPDANRRRKGVSKAVVPWGWPDDVPIPAWWVELFEAFPAGFFKEARAQTCGDGECGFGVAVRWFCQDTGAWTWSCPACGRTQTDERQRCRCGSTAWRDVPIHDGQSIRRDCARCGRMISFKVWYGKAL